MSMKRLTLLHPFDELIDAETRRSLARGEGFKSRKKWPNNGL
ncbi:hypothetical protein CHELA17_50081 [Chelatococcus asaccharovorans]|nr:hypothetical protein CHELA17_50081 [Chelatococcus asaccharovorans]